MPFEVAPTAGRGTFVVGIQPWRVDPISLADMSAPDSRRLPRSAWVAASLLACVLPLTFSACGSSPATGTVRGNLGEAGSVSVRFHPVTGTVRLAGPTGTYTAHVGISGHFVVHIPTGTYEITGRNSKFESGKWVCGGGRHRVEAGKSTHADVTCELF